MKPPSHSRREAYALTLRDTLDSFVRDSHRLTGHKVEVFGGMVVVDIVADAGRPTPVKVWASRWVEFGCSARMYNNARTYVFKPIDLHEWTMQKAIEDAKGIVSDALTPAPYARTWRVWLAGWLHRLGRKLVSGK